LPRLHAPMSYSASEWLPQEPHSKTAALRTPHKLAQLAAAAAAAAASSSIEEESSPLACPAPPLVSSPALRITSSTSPPSARRPCAGSALTVARRRQADEGRRRPLALSLTDLDDDCLESITNNLEGSAMERYGMLQTLAATCKRLNPLLNSPMVAKAVEEASRQMLGEARLYAEPPEGETLDFTAAAVIDLSGRGIGPRECKLLARMVGRGELASTRSLWLQNNKIDAHGLLALADGLRQMPEDSKLRSISLGFNAFTGFLPESKQALRHVDCAAVREAVRALEAAAAAQRVRVRLWS